MARARLTSLGFVVAPTGIHPFGTENCCVFLADGTYLEPLAVGDEQAAANAIADGNVFVARDRVYRDSCGDEGFSAVVLGTGNADADHARYVEAGISAGDVLSFSRAFTDAAGKSDMASFKLAFAAGSGSTDAFLFACERINAPEDGPHGVAGPCQWRDRHRRSRGGQRRPAEQRRLISIAADSDAGSQHGAFDLPNAALTVLEPAAFAARFGIPAGAPTDLASPRSSFRSAAPMSSQSCLQPIAIEHDIAGNDIVVQPASGQGAAFIFREIDMSKPNLAPNSSVTVGNAVFANNAPLALIAGPCQLEIARSTPSTWPAR